MPEHLPLPLKHLRFSAPPEIYPFSRRAPVPFNLHSRTNREGHVDYLRRQINAVQEVFDSISEQRQTTELTSEFGLILNVSSEPDHPLKYESLEKAPSARQAGISLLNLRHEQTAAGLITKAAIFVPYGQLQILERKISEYADPSKDSRNREGVVTNPKNAPLLNNIHSISVAAFDALWTDPEPIPESNTPTWFELWIRRDQGDWESQLRTECEQLDIAVPDQKLLLPDHIVLVVQATRQQLESSLDLLNCLSEVRIARPCSIGLTDLTGVEQEDWIDEALARIQWPNEDAPAVCILDTGVNRNHDLIEPILQSSDMSTVFGDGDVSDDTTLKHGTPMAGLAAFGDLRNLMLSAATWDQFHRLESVKLIRSSTDHDPDNYGAVTLQGINEPESIAPNRPRVFCMAVTAPGQNTRGNPSSWSSAVDIAASGTQADDDKPRVILVSTGNVADHNNTFNYPQTIEDSPIEDPAQAWNAITVGAITTRANIEEDNDEARRATAVAPSHGLSPFTRTSHEWRTDWPIGPDIVMEGGNLASAPDGSYPHYDSLTPLSTASNFAIRPLTPFCATSAATALAARAAARITQRYPDLLPETVRGLLVHSARWPEELMTRENFDPHRVGNSENVEALMRSYGYGIVNEQRALESLNNETTFFCENTIQPFKGAAGSASLNECHLIALPWPRTLLESNPDKPVTMRVTLSYFIQPNPGSRTWEKGQKYRYASHLLRFRPKHRDMDLDEFRARLDSTADTTDDTFTDPGWALGARLRGKSGSLVQDVWKGTTSQLAEMGHIGIFPAKGWWATRKYGADRTEHNCHLKSVPYSLIISIETEENLPIYSEVSNAIAEIEASVDVDA